MIIKPKLGGYLYAVVKVAEVPIERVGVKAKGLLIARRGNEV